MQDSWDIYSYPLYKQFRDHTPEFAEMAAFQGGLTDLSVRRSGSNAPAEPFEGEFVTGNYFSTFGVGAFAGRTITPADDQPNATPVAVMSYRAWQEHFALDPAMIAPLSRSIRRLTRLWGSPQRDFSEIACAPIRRISGYL